jgi:HD-GYP domain-containing protein (c-di-GMP phosphodiesterase class II)
MTTDRSYRPALSVESAVEELGRCRGSQFDPLVVQALEGLVSIHATPTRRPARRGIAA